MAISDLILKRLFGDPNSKTLTRLQGKVQAINALEPEMQGLSDEALKAKTDEFRQRLLASETMDDLLPEAFAVVREASQRVLEMRHFDVQLIGGIVMHEGNIAEMKTGEGKTLVSTLPCYLNALSGEGVYVVTVNDYLAKRDKEWMGILHEFLGLSVGLIQSEMPMDEKAAAYDCDIVYGTNNEFGFDYLRDNLATDLQSLCQKKRCFAIIDEVDSILIDEARTPLIISGPVPDSSEKYATVLKVVRALTVDDDFNLDEKHKNVVLTEAGIEKIEKKMGISDVYSTQNMELAHMAVQCLRALHLYQKDVDYVIREQSVQIVDEFTGRVLEGRRYSDGLHQAIEAAEALPIKEESQTIASVTYQNYFRLFPKLAGMTGTAVTEAEEFQKIYGLGVVAIPTNVPIARQDQPDVVYKSKAEKYKAVVNEIAERHKSGQPMLVGTISIDSSEQLSTLLKKKGIAHNVLNAKYHEQEADIISNAGQKGAVTIATNMAGRGTDIKLGEGVKALGGLYVIGTERHESRRIDNQLRGRSGRQGDEGESRFYVALDDDLMRLFGSDRIAKVMETLGLPPDTPIEHGMISKSIERAQKKVEQYHFSVRKQILEYDDVMDKQRETIYEIRRGILSKEAIDERVKEGIGTVLAQVVAYEAPEGLAALDDAGLNQLSTTLQEWVPVQNMMELLQMVKGNDTAISEIEQAFFQLYLKRKAQYPEGIFEEAVTVIMLRSLDSKWMDHLHNMDVLREGIGLRAYGQKDPLVEYKREAFDLFNDLLTVVMEESLRLLYRVEISLDPEALKRESVLKGAEDGPLSSEKGSDPKKIGRNDACPCGSGKNIKNAMGWHKEDLLCMP